MIRGPGAIGRAIMNAGPVPVREVGDVLEAVIALARARAAKREARKAWVVVATAAGRCEGMDLDEEQKPCYKQPPGFEWCESCAAREPAHRAFRTASTAAAAAVRRVLAIGAALDKAREANRV